MAQYILNKFSQIEGNDGINKYYITIRYWDEQKSSKSREITVADSHSTCFLVESWKCCILTWESHLICLHPPLQSPFLSSKYVARHHKQCLGSITTFVTQLRALLVRDMCKEHSSVLEPCVLKVTGSIPGMSRQDWECPHLKSCQSHPEILPVRVVYIKLEEPLSLYCIRQLPVFLWYVPLVISSLSTESSRTSYIQPSCVCFIAQLTCH